MIFTDIGTIFAPIIIEMTTTISIMHFDSSRLKENSSEDLPFVASWITETGELPIISGFKKNILSSNELNEWFDSAAHNIVIKHQGKIIGLATLSLSEATLPADSIEVCHTIVAPKYRRLYNGADMILHLCSIAKQIGYKKVVGRVTKSNTPGRMLLKYLRWQELVEENYSNDPTVTWFQKEFL